MQGTSGMFPRIWRKHLVMLDIIGILNKIGRSCCQTSDLWPLTHLNKDPAGFNQEHPTLQEYYKLMITCPKKRLKILETPLKRFKTLEAGTKIPR